MHKKNILGISFPRSLSRTTDCVTYDCHGTEALPG